MTVADVDTMIIEAGINEVDIGKVRLNQPVKLSLDAYPKVKFAGKIQRIAPAARLEEKVKVFDVEIAIDRQGTELRTGMTANIDIVGDKRQKVLTVPVEAIFKKDETEVVYLKKPEAPAKKAEGGLLASAFAAGKKDAPATKLDPRSAWKEKFEVKEIETGLAAVDKVEVVKGLSAGMEVAVEDPTRPRRRRTMSDTVMAALAPAAVRAVPEAATTALPLIRMEGVTKTYAAGELAVQALAGVDLGDPGGGVRRHHRPVRVRQVDADAHPGLSRSADLGVVPAGWRGGGGTG